MEKPWSINDEFDEKITRKQQLTSSNDIHARQRREYINTPHWLPEYEKDYQHELFELASIEAWLVKYRKRPEVVAEVAVWRALAQDLLSRD